METNVSQTISGLLPLGRFWQNGIFLILFAPEALESPALGVKGNVPSQPYGEPCSVLIPSVKAVLTYAQWKGKTTL